MKRVGQVLAVLALIVTTACSDTGRDLPDPQDFRAGTCREAAQAVVSLDETARLAVQEDADAEEVRAALRSRQEMLQELLGDAEAADGVADELDEVVARAGFARAAFDTGSISEAVVQDVHESVDAFVAACVPGSGE